jgi:predicted transcriptional regulator
MTQNEFLNQIEEFLAERRMSHTAFGKSAVHDASFVTRLRKGADVKLKTVEKILRWMDQQREAENSDAAA